MRLRLPEQLYHGKQQSVPTISTLDGALPISLKKNSQKLLTLKTEIQYQRGRLQNRQRILTRQMIKKSENK
jgi:hypothetical protein